MLVRHNVTLDDFRPLQDSLPEHVGAYPPQVAREAETLADEHVIGEVVINDRDAFAVFLLTLLYVSVNDTLALLVLFVVVSAVVSAT